MNNYKAWLKRTAIFSVCCVMCSGLLIGEDSGSAASSAGKRLESIYGSLEGPETVSTVNAVSFASLKDFSGIDLVAFEGTGLSFVIGEDVNSFSSRRYLKSFYMNRYETTYRLWYFVRKWAELNGYVFENPGQEGAQGGRGKVPSEFYGDQPVTNINWYDAIVWCNALSEHDGRTPCYTYKGIVLRDSTDTASCDLAKCDFSANGYRLPSEAEWEYAARKTKNGFQSGACGSGQVNEKGETDLNVPYGEIAWYDENTDTTRVVGTAGTPFVKNAPPSPGSGNPNGSGIFDMSGNVLEYCWDWMSEYKDVKEGTECFGPEYGAERVARGGSWSPYSLFTFVADRYSFDPNEAYTYLGFRFCCSEK